MKIPIDQFELHVDEKILQRGLSYFKKDTVQDVSRTSDGKLQARVVGTDDYRVVIEFDEEYVHSHRCDCPYDMGPICKHVVAVIFYTQQEKLDISASAPKKKKRVSKPKPNPVKEIMDQIGLSELQDFLITECKSQKEFETRFITTFSHYTSTSSRSFYQKQIRAILKKAAGRKGFIFRGGSRMVTDHLKPLLENAESALESDQDIKCFQIGSALLEETVKGLQFIDDSNGYYGELVNNTAILLDRLSCKPLEDSVRKDFLKYCMNSLSKKVYEGWDWHLDTLKMSVNLVTSKSEANKVSKYTHDLSEYSRDEGIMVNFQLLQEFGTKKEVQSYIQANMSCGLMREYLVETAIEDGDFERAIELCEKGVSILESWSYSQKLSWHDWLLVISQKTNNKEDTIKYARGMFLNNHHLDQQYYSILKSTVDPQDWKEFVEDLIEIILEIDGWKGYHLLHKIYVEEGYWDRLLKLVLRNPSLDNLKENEKYLAPHYTEKYIKLYEKGVYEYLEHRTGRSSYRQACRFLTRMNKLGGNITVNKMIDVLRSKYPQRRALMDELDKV